MKAAALALPAALLLPALLLPARAQFEGITRSVDGKRVRQEEDAATRELAARLQSDPALAQSLARRVERSSIAQSITSARDPAQRERDIAAWIASDPESAANVAIGLAQDDARGDHAFENMVSGQFDRDFKLNPGARRGLYARLSRASRRSRLLMRQSGGMSDEETREILKTMFEGRGGESNKIITLRPASQGGAASGAGATLASGFYNRLSRTNLRGYSPQLQALQSELNRGRPPGAPNLIETGKLDYPTLSYPAYGMRFDIGTLERRLGYERAFAAAKALGLSARYTPEQLLDPSVQRGLEKRAQAAGKAPDAGFARRQQALESAAAALSEFSRAALAAKDPNGITRDLLLSLGAKQKQAARWITVASLEEELRRIELEQDFPEPGLVAVIEDCPVPDSGRRLYLRRARLFAQNLRSLKASDSDAVSALESDGWLPRLDAIQSQLDSAAALRKDLFTHIDDLRLAAFRLERTTDRRSRWRRLLDDLIERYLPGTAYARSLRSAERSRRFLQDAFLKIASGDLDAAHAMLATGGGLP
ncbi:MAG: hypothetical protein KGO96_05625 [Elusimicrobia bacterium]|nr:hypothetical protein [Elusimicrobiota bacterium]MDE2237347.1 hypothetical protein [Elusimicrobiota bacterium]MDE2425369.1 hypothetical protein [Elusimicrobiota bacterium]